MGEDETKDLKITLDKYHPVSESIDVLPPVQLEPFAQVEIRLFLSSSFIDTQAERDVIIKKISTIRTICPKSAS